VRSRLLLCLFLISFLTLVPATAGRIVVNHDEWTTANAGFTNAGAANVTQFVQNVAAFMNINGGPGNFLIWSSNFSLNGPNATSFQAALTSGGYSFTVDPSLPMTLANLSPYDGIFMAGAPIAKNDTVLTQYVNNGGSVYIAAGTGSFSGGAAGEAAYWNSFLSNFDLALAPTYNGCCGVDTVEGTHPVLAGVAQLYYNNGNTLSVVGLGPNSQIIERQGPTGAGVGLIGVYDNVPEPSTYLLLSGGLAVLAFARKLRSRA